MSGYQPARRGPNVSQYIAGLNAIPPPASGDEVASLDNEDYNFDDDLALFTNTVFDEKDFVDFNVDFGANLTQSPLGFGPNTVVHNPRSDNPPPPPLNGDIDTMNFDTGMQANHFVCLRASWHMLRYSLCPLSAIALCLPSQRLVLA